MIFHYFKSTLSQFKRSPLFSFINLFGLATSMAICLLIFLYVFRELSFDRFHDQAHNIYRISLHINMQGEEHDEAVTSAPMGPDLKEAFPEVIDFVRLSPLHPVEVWHDDRNTTINNSLMADSTFFTVFAFNLIQGDPSTALSEPYSLVLTRKLGRDLFEDDDPMGQLLRLNDDPRPYIVTGIAADCPANSHIQFDLIRPYIQQFETSTSNFTDWDANIGSFTYLRLEQGTDLEGLLAKTEKLTWDKVNYKFEGMGVSLGLGFYPITDIRLRSTFNHEMVETGTISKVWMFSAVALFVLFIAGFNYVNLTIARSGKRAREVGIRKVLGAHKKSLNIQFLLETLFITGISFLAALLLVEISLPLFNQMLDTSLSLINIPWWIFLMAIIIFVGIFGVLASLYPAWYMASFQPVKILKGEFWKKPGGFQPRNLLLLLQFIVSLGLMVCTLVIFLQIRYFNIKDYGFDYKGVIAIQANNLEDAHLFAQAMESFPWVTDQSIASTFPAGTTYMEGITPQELEPGFMAHRLWADKEYFSTMGIQMQTGRSFTRDDGLEEDHVIVNQALVRKTGWADPLGKTIERQGRHYTIVGVVNDYHFQSLHHEVQPLLINVIGNRPANLQHPFWILIKYDEISNADVLMTIQKQWETTIPGNTLRFHFISNLMDTAYAGERSFGRLFLALTLLAIIIAMLGILGLSAFAAQQRQKEFGIRRVLGASRASVLTKLSLDFLRWILLAALVALPAAFLLMQRWLTGFAYAISFPWWTMILALMAMLIITMMIVIVQTLKAAGKNPVEVLKTE